MPCTGSPVEQALGTKDEAKPRYGGEIGFTGFVITDPPYGDIELAYITER